MRRSAIILVLILTLTLILGTNCTAGEETGANAEDGHSTEIPTLGPGDAPQPTDTGVFILGDGGGGGVFAVDMYLKITGIEGESTDENHKGWIDILAWSWSMSQADGGLSTSVGGRTAERAVFQDFTITKTVDKASPMLMKACANGQHLPEVILDVRRAGEDQQEYIEYKMNDVFVTSMTSDGSDETLPIEEVSFNYRRIEWTYTEYDSSTGKAKGEVKAGWDLEANKEL